MYKNKETGATMSIEAMQAAADRNGMNITEYAAASRLCIRIKKMNHRIFQQAL